MKNNNSLTYHDVPKGFLRKVKHMGVGKDLEVSKEGRKLKGKRKSGIKRLSVDYVYMRDKPVFKPGSLKSELEANNKGSFKLKRNTIRNGSRPHKFFKSPEPSSIFFNNNIELFEDMIDVDRSCIIGGCFDTNKHTIQQQMDCTNFDGEMFPTKNAFEKMEEAIKAAIRKIKIVHLPIPDIEELEDVHFDLSTKPGFRYEEYFRLFNKRDARDLAMKIAKERWIRIENFTLESKLVKREGIIPGIISIGARNKREENPEEGEYVKSRAIHMPEFHTEIHCGAFIDRITETIKDRPSGPIYIGNSYLNYSRLQRDMDKNIFALEGDWKNFDSKICNSLILMSLSILRCFYEKSFKVDNHFLAILDSIVIKDYVMPGGFMYRILHGLPSGSKLTSLLGSVFNLLCLLYSMSFINSKKLSFAIGGDDFVIFIRQENVDLDEVEEKFLLYSSNIGMVIKVFYRRNYRSGKFMDMPVFYKYTVYKGVPVVPAVNLIERSFVPWNKRYDDSEKLLEFLNEIMTSLGYPMSNCLIFYAYYTDVYYRVFKKRLKLHDVYKMHKTIYYKMQRRGFLYTKKEDISLSFCPMSNDYPVSKYVKYVFGI